MSIGFDLDAPCGRFLSFRDLIECGESWASMASSVAKFTNSPKEADTLDALIHLCATVIDPVIEKFGSVELTYGLSCNSLSRRIESTVGRVDRKGDQHASHERSSKGNRICTRDGAAVDFFVPEVSSLEVAKWVVRNTDFDRLYFYRDDLPIHASASMNPLGQISVVKEPRGKAGVGRPSKELFLELT